MLIPFTVANRHGEKFLVRCERHRNVCWKLIISAVDEQIVGDLLYEPSDDRTMKLLDFHIYSEFAGQGIGREVLTQFLALLRSQGYVEVIGICKSYDRPLAAKERLVDWYSSFGFELTRESLPQEPGYLGRLKKLL